LTKGAKPSLRYEIKGLNINDAEKFEQYSKVTRKLSKNNRLGGWSYAAAIFPAFSKIKHF